MIRNSSFLKLTGHFVSNEFNSFIKKGAEVQFYTAGDANRQITTYKVIMFPITSQGSAVDRHPQRLHDQIRTWIFIICQFLVHSEDVLPRTPTHHKLNYKKSILKASFHNLLRKTRRTIKLNTYESAKENLIWIRTIDRNCTILTGDQSVGKLEYTM